MKAKQKTGIICMFLLFAGFSSCKDKQVSTDLFDNLKIEGGYISGTMNSSGDVHIFRGIPYAAPPLGEFRWRAPQPVQSWEGIKKCDTFGPSPMQPSPEPFYMWSQEFLIPKEPISEDCLYLNVWTGAKSQVEKRPVLVWIYGGGFSSGSGSVPIYDGEEMAKKGIVVVNVNYRLPDLQQAEQTGSRITGELKVNSLAQLRNMSAEDLLKQAQFSAHPIVDGYVIPESVPLLYSQNKGNNVVLLTGWNEDEGIVISPFKNAAEYKQYIEKQYGSDSKELLQYYPATTDAEAAVSHMKLQRDIVFGAQNYTLANNLSIHGKKVYVYRFTRKVPGIGQYEKYGAFHTGEVPYAFDNLKYANRPWTAIDYKLANTISTYWVNFVKSGDPNGEDLADWPTYKPNSKLIMELGDQTHAILLKDTASLDFMYNKLNVLNR